jgi:alkanesulfonate monooxygenase SsuD/methylene tetrahydromethanopterin reductase-like flavin-dependent oxidoreductase (luciferase family)
VKPIRFGLIAAAADATELIQTAQSADHAGYSTIALNDHFNSTVAPLVGLQAIAGVTSRVRLATAVLNQDLRHPAVLAKEVATLDAFTGGRVELGLGAGWVPADYEQSGIPFEPAPRRIARLAETIDILKQLFGCGTCTFAGQAIHHHRSGKQAPAGATRRTSHPGRGRRSTNPVDGCTASRHHSGSGGELGH